MALTVSNLSRGNYVLGGLGRMEGPSAAEAMDLAQREEQRARDAARQARETEQRMRLALSAEGREQQRFQMDIEDRNLARSRAAAAAGRAARDEAARRDLIAGLALPGAAAATPAPAAPGIGVRPRPTSPNLGYNNLPAGPQAPAFPLGTPVPSGGGGTSTLPGGAGGDTLMPPPLPPQAGLAVPRIDRAREPGVQQGFRVVRPEANADLGNGWRVENEATGQSYFAYSVLGEDGQPVFQFVEIPPPTGRGAPISTDPGFLSPTAPPPSDIPPDVWASLTPAERADILAFQDPTQGTRSSWAAGTTPFNPDLRPGFFAETLAPGRADTMRVNANIAAANAAASETRPVPRPVPGAGGTETEAETEAAVAAGAAEGAPPIIYPSTAGVTMPFTPPVQLAFARGDDAPSERYLNNIDLIQMDRDSLAQQIARERAALEYLMATGDETGYQQATTITQRLRALDQLQIEQRYLDGMATIAAIQNNNFGPLQVLLQQRPEFQGRNLQVLPYTDGTVDIVVDGQIEATLEMDTLVEDLRTVYDQGYQAYMQAEAEAMRELTLFELEQRIEQSAIADREIAVANNQASIDILEANGTITRIGETSTGEAVFEAVSANGMPVQFVYREETVRAPNGESVTVLVATPTDQARVR